MRKTKFASFSASDREAVKSHSNVLVHEVEIPDPESESETIAAVLIETI